MRLAPALRRLDRLLVPAHLRRNHRPLSTGDQAELRDLLVRQYFAPQFPASYLDTTEGRLDLWTHVTGRVDVARRTCVPWLDALRPLERARVLEIGCGTGGGTVAFAEQGARVVGIDVVPEHLAIAGRRCTMYGVQAELVRTNAAELTRVLAGRTFDLVVFLASLEHMTLDERVAALAGAFELLSPAGACVVLDTPNRLWPFDDHTAMAPFFHWLPDELALRLGATSPRPLFAGWCAADARDRAGLARWGRGLSYHELDLALGRGRYEVVSTMTRYFGATPRRWLGLWVGRACRVAERMESDRAAGATPGLVSSATGVRAPGAGRELVRRAQRAVVARSCKRVLRAYAGPDVDGGFLEPWLQLAVRPVPSQGARLPAPAATPESTAAGPVRAAADG